MQIASTLQQSLSIAGLELGAPLGRGESGAVYRATRKEVECVIKLPAGTQLTPEQASSFLREASMLARVEHKGLARIFEAGWSDNHPYMVMEFIDGDTLANKIAAGGLTEKQVVGWAIELADTLTRVHQIGIVHRDIKPSNIMIDRDGATRLIDFGLAQAADAGDAAYAGSFGYSPPEQTGMIKRTIDGRADLYSLGVVLYEALTGRPPFEAADVSELIRLHAVQPPPDLRAKRGVSPAFAEIVHKLLAKDPDDRYQSAAALAVDLRQLDKLNQEVTRGLRLGTQMDRAGRYGDGPLIGRVTEIERLRAELGQVFAGAGRTMLVNGASGLGKSRLVRELLADAEDGEAVILRGKCEKGDVTPFAPIRDAMDELARRAQRWEPTARERVELIEASESVAGALAMISTRMAALLGVDARQGASGDKEAFLNLLAQFFIRYAKRSKGVVLFVDDVQWADPGTRTLLSLLANERAARLLVICAARNDEASRPAIERFRGEAGRGLDGEITLTPFDPASVRAYTIAYLNNSDISDDIVDQLQVRSQGSPFAINEYLRTLLDGGALLPHWGTWTLDRSRFEKLQLPTNILDLIMGRVESLGEDTRRVLAHAAVLGNQFDVSTLGRLYGDESGMHLGLAHALGASLIERTDTGYAFVHDRILEAMLGSVGEAELRRMHDAAARCLAAQDSELHVYAIAGHVLSGELADPAFLFDACLAAGKRAHERNAPTEAVRFFNEVAGAGERCNRTLDIPTTISYAEACARAGDLTRASALFAGAIDRETDAPKRAGIRGALMMEVLNTNALYEQGLEQMRLAWNDMGRPFSQNTALLMLGGVSRFLSADRAYKRGRGYGTLTGEARDAATRQLRLIESSCALTFMVSRDDLWLYFAARFFELGRAVGPSRGLTVGEAAAGMFWAAMNKPLKAAEHAHLGVAEAEKTGDRLQVALAHYYRGLIYDLSGLSGEAHEYYRETWTDYRHWIDQFSFGSLAVIYTLSCGMRGYAHEAISVMETTVQQVETLPGTPATKERRLAYYRSQLITPYCLVGRVDDARRLSQSIWDYYRENPAADPFGFHVFLAHHLFLCAETGDDPDPTAVAEFVSKRKNPAMLVYLLRHFYVEHCRQLLTAYAKADDAGRGPLRGKIEAALKWLRAAAKHKVALLAGSHALQGAWHVLNARPQRAEAELARAEQFAWRSDSPRWLFEVAVWRARLAVAAKQPVVVRQHAETALKISLEHGWIVRQRAVRNEFATDVHAASDPKSASNTRVSGKAVTLKRHLDALLQVSLATSAIINPDEQSRVALDEIVKVLGAERAFLFLAQPDGTVVRDVGRDHEGRDVPADAKFSTTAVERVRVTGAPIVVTGTDEGDLIGSQSAVAQGLRSIMAAPVMLRNRLVGVIYLDSRVAKGVFTEPDLEILVAVGNHIAIAKETAKTAQIELERTALEKDLEVTRAVQSMLLPAKDTYRSNHVSLAGFYRPASQSGGDWWAYDARPDGTTVVIVGDVTGHGAGAAMVTAAVASAYRTIVGRNPEIGVNETIDAMNAALKSLTAGVYRMTMSIAVIDPQRNEVAWWNAGGPPIFLSRARDQSINAVAAPSGALGGADYSLVEKRFEFTKGDRLIMFTDGLSELKVDEAGGYLGLRKLRGMIKDIGTLDAEQARAQLIRDADALRGDVAQDDDISFVVLDRFVSAKD